MSYRLIAKVEAGALAAELAHFAKICTSNQSIQVLRNVMLDGRDGTLRIYGTDLDNALLAAVPASGIIEKGAVIVETKKLVTMVRSIDKATVIKLTETDDGLLIEHGTSKAKIPLTELTHYPDRWALPVFKYWMQTPELLRLLTNTEDAVTKDESRYALAGVNFVKRNNRIECQATDGHRAHIATTTAGTFPDKGGFILPKSAFGIIRSILGEKRADDYFHLGFTEDDAHVGFKLGERILWCRKLTGQFADFSKVWPSTLPPISFTVVAGQMFHAALKRMMQVLPEDNTSKVVTVFVDQNELILSIEDGDGSVLHERIPVINKSKKTPIFSLYRGYLLDAFSLLCKQEAMTVNMTNAVSPILFSLSKSTGAILIMPHGKDKSAAKMLEYACDLAPLAAAEMIVGELGGVDAAIKRYESGGSVDQHRTGLEFSRKDLLKFIQVFKPEFMKGVEPEPEPEDAPEEEEIAPVSEPDTPLEPATEVIDFDQLVDRRSGDVLLTALEIVGQFTSVEAARDNIDTEATFFLDAYRLTPELVNRAIQIISEETGFMRVFNELSEGVFDNPRNYAAEACAEILDGFGDEVNNYLGDTNDNAVAAESPSGFDITPYAVSTALRVRGALERSAS